MPHFHGPHTAPGQCSHRPSICTPHQLDLNIVSWLHSGDQVLIHISTGKSRSIQCEQDITHLNMLVAASRNCGEGGILRQVQVQVQVQLHPIIWHNLNQSLAFGRPFLFFFLLLQPGPTIETHAHPNKSSKSLATATKPDLRRPCLVQPSSSDFEDRRQPARD